MTSAQNARTKVRDRKHHRAISAKAVAVAKHRRFYDQCSHPLDDFLSAGFFRQRAGDDDTDRRLSLPDTGTTTASDAGGADVAIGQTLLHKVEIGDWVMHDVKALARNYNGAAYLPHLDGILGLNFFEGRLLTLDFRRRRVIIGSGALPPADGKTVLPFELVEGNIAIRAMLGGQMKQILVDTGNIRALDIPTSWLPAMPLASSPRLAGNSSSVSGTTPIREARGKCLPWSNAAHLMTKGGKCHEFREGHFPTAKPKLQHCDGYLLLSSNSGPGRHPFGWASLHGCHL